MINDSLPYELCALCDHFVDPEDDGFVHLDDGEHDHDHTPTPSGDVRTLAQWQHDRPDLFPWGPPCNNAAIRQHLLDEAL